MSYYRVVTDHSYTAFACGIHAGTQQLTLLGERAGIELWQGSLYWVLVEDTSLSQGTFYF